MGVFFMRVEHLKYLVEVAQTGSMSKAAKNLFVTQPAISNAISALEQEIGWPILERSISGVQPTTKGMMVVDDARHILRMIARWSDVLDIANIDKITGDVFIGDYSEIGLSFFQDTVMELNRRYPKLTVHSVPLRDNPLKDLNNGQFQMTVLPIVPSHHKTIEAYLSHYDWSMSTLYQGNCKLMVSPCSELARDAVITTDMLVGYDLWAYPDFPYQQALEKQIRKVQVNFDEPLRLVTMVSNNDAVAIFPPSQDVLLRKFVESGIMLEREISDLPIPMEINLIYSNFFSWTEAGQLIINTIKNRYSMNL